MKRALFTSVLALAGSYGIAANAQQVTPPTNTLPAPSPEVTPPPTSAPPPTYAPPPTSEPPPTYAPPPAYTPPPTYATPAAPPQGEAAAPSYERARPAPSQAF